MINSANLTMNPVFFYMHHTSIAINSLPKRLNNVYEHGSRSVSHSPITVQRKNYSLNAIVKSLPAVSPISTSNLPIQEQLPEYAGISDTDSIKHDSENV